MSQRPDRIDTSHPCVEYLLGTPVLKVFKDPDTCTRKVYEGRVSHIEASVRSTSYFRVVFEDGDFEDLNPKELASLFKQSGELMAQKYLAANHDTDDNGSFTSTTQAAQKRSDTKVTKQGGALHEQRAFIYNVTRTDGLSGTMQIQPKNKSSRARKYAVPARVANYEYGVPRQQKDHTSFSFDGRVTSLWYCSCQFHTHWGLPCRHMIRLFTKLTSKVGPVPLFLVNPFWQRSHIAHTDFSHKPLAPITPDLHPATRGHWHPNDAEFNTAMKAFAGYLNTDCYVKLKASIAMRTCRT